MDTNLEQICPQSECDCCGFSNVGVEIDFPLQRFERRDLPPHTEYKWLCELCARSMAGVMMDFPRDYPDYRSVAMSCFVGNMILKELRKKKE